MKRKSDGSLTGGTGDVNPQWLKIRLAETVADTTISVQQTIPVQRLQDRSGKSQVMEILRVYFMFENLPEVDSAQNIVLTTKNFGTTNVVLNDPSIIAFSNNGVRLTTSGQYYAQQPYMIDVTDGAGHGLLVATDSIFMQVNSATTGATVTCNAHILYRWKNVSLAEYIGIVQSQS